MNFLVSMGLSSNTLQSERDRSLERGRSALPGDCSSDAHLRLPSCLFYIRVSCSLEAEANESKIFELQNENFKLDDELEESDPPFHECSTRVVMKQ